MFERESMLESTWYKARLASQQTSDQQAWKQHVAYLDHFLKKESHRMVASRLNIEERLTAAKAQLERVKKDEYREDLIGSIGRQPIAKRS
jgi:hypothetical protein